MYEKARDDEGGAGGGDGGDNGCGGGEGGEGGEAGAGGVSAMLKRKRELSLPRALLVSHEQY